MFPTTPKRKNFCFTAVSDRSAVTVIKFLNLHTLPSPQIVCLIFLIPNSNWHAVLEHRRQPLGFHFVFKRGCAPRRVFAKRARSPGCGAYYICEPCDLCWIVCSSQPASCFDQRKQEQQLTQRDICVGGPYIHSQQNVEGLKSKAKCIKLGLNGSLVNNTMRRHGFASRPVLSVFLSLCALGDLLQGCHSRDQQSGNTGFPLKGALIFITCTRFTDGRSRTRAGPETSCLPNILHFRFKCEWGEYKGTPEVYSNFTQHESFQ